jgi:hypothetical protein
VIRAAVRSARPALAAAAAAVLAACSYTTDTSPFLPAESSALPFAVVDSRPRADDTGVGLDADIALTFSDWPDPGSLSQFGPITLRSGENSFDFAASVDLVSKTVVLRPRTRFAPQNRYVVVLSSSLRSLSGGRLAPTMLGFTTGSEPGGALPPPVPWGFDAVKPALVGECAIPSCHGDQDTMGGMQLTADVAYANLVGARATEVEMQRVAPGDPASSYLLRKLLGTPAIIGQPMPIGASLPADQLRMISDWIATGAASTAPDGGVPDLAAAADAAPATD